MPIKFKSNYNQFSKRLANYSFLIDDAMRATVETVLQHMCDDMKAEIARERDVWQERGSSLDLLSLGDDITYEIEGNQGTLYVGRNTSLITVGEGVNQRQVNPYLFIQFGYGIVGEENPVRYHTQNGWEYNINNHDKAWFYWGTSGERIQTSGRRGIDFFYNVISKYRKKWKEFANLEFLKRFS